MFSPAGHRETFLLPDRSRYINMEAQFLHSYMDLLVQTCHRRGALATSGMVAVLLPQDQHGVTYQTIMAAVNRQELLTRIQKPTDVQMEPFMIN